MISSNLKKSPLALALGLSMAAGVATSAQASDNPFGATDLSSGYLQLAEGKCGEAKCGGKKEAEAKCGG